MGDTMWYFIGLCRQLNCSLEDIFKNNIEKLEKKKSYFVSVKLHNYFCYSNIFEIMFSSCCYLIIFCFFLDFFICFIFILPISSINKYFRYFVLSFIVSSYLIPNLLYNFSASFIKKSAISFCDKLSSIFYVLYIEYIHIIINASTCVNT